MSGKCIFCGSAAYGSCANSPHKRHEHHDDEKHCVFCGSMAYGSCGNSPYKKHNMEAVLASACIADQSLLGRVRTVRMESTRGSHQGVVCLWQKANWNNTTAIGGLKSTNTSQ